ncbi:hypothetical protein F5X96DRAFT_35473 [Biscogniauxia mediterranea]|nr:hypothetical protein F5X96DRAFT_35473 [Biscogniauxia mediterranea]
MSQQQEYAGPPPRRSTPLKRALLIARTLGYTLSFFLSLLSRSLSQRLRLLSHNAFFSSISSSSPSDSDEKEKPGSRNIVVVGASFAGYHAARAIASALAPGSPYRVVVVEPRDHFHFTWVLPRFCVVTHHHEHKAFIPYGPYVASAADRGTLAWVRGRVVAVERGHVAVRCRLEEGAADAVLLPYDYLVVATGSGSGDGLPSRVGADAKGEGVRRLREMQERIRGARSLVVVGGGAAGVELAADAKAVYPGKRVVLVHSRDRVMHRFGPELRDAAAEGLRELGVEIVTGDRVVGEDTERGVVTLRSGREIACDFLVNCVGQKPDSRLIAALSPDAISETGHILVKPTLQIQDDSLPNIYACGDVAETHVERPNARSAMNQAMIAADNILLAIQGKEPTRVYKHHWVEGVIKLTLGLDKSVSYLSDGVTELLFRSKEKDIALMSARAWKQLGAKPFEDNSEVMDKIAIDPWMHDGKDVS